jgi:hypothetical protein
LQATGRDATCDELAAGNGDAGAGAGHTGALQAMCNDKWYNIVVKYCEVTNGVKRHFVQGGGWAWDVATSERCPKQGRELDTRTDVQGKEARHTNRHNDQLCDLMSDMQQVSPTEELQQFEAEPWIPVGFGLQQDALEPTGYTRLTRRMVLATATEEERTAFSSAMVGKEAIELGGQAGRTSSKWHHTPADKDRDTHGMVVMTSAFIRMRTRAPKVRVVVIFSCQWCSFPTP